MERDGKTQKNTDRPAGCSGGAAAGPPVGPLGASGLRIKLGAEGKSKLKTNNKTPTSSGEGP